MNEITADAKTMGAMLATQAWRCRGTNRSDNRVGH
jgi:hypothetical protein